MDNRPKNWNDVRKRIKASKLVELFGGMPEVYDTNLLYKDPVLPDPGTTFKKTVFPSLLILKTPAGHEYVIAVEGANYARNAALLIRGS
jgi:hypothetical protein